MKTIEGIPSTRRQLVDETAADAGEAWARVMRDALQREGRRAAGGWPGTIGEARVRASSVIGMLLRRNAMSALSHAELGAAASAVYGAARRAWLSAPDVGAADDDDLG